MSTRYTKETALNALKDFKASKGTNNIYITVKITSLNGLSEKPFCASAQEYYVGYYSTPIECYDAVMVRRSQKIKIPTVYKEKLSNPPSDILRSKAGKAIERGFYDDALKHALNLNDQNLINFINRLKLQVA